MKLSAVLLARTLAFVDINELNPRGAIFLPHLVPIIVGRFNFQIYPTKIDDFDEEKGVSFKSGYIDGQTIDELTLYGDGLKIDVRSSTEQGQAILTKTLEWLASEHGIAYTSSSIRRWAYISNLVFDSDVDLDFINPAITALNHRLAHELRDDRRVTEGFHVEGINIDVDRSAGAKQMVSFSLRRRANIPFSEGKYYSGSPLSTNVHISVLEELEEALRKHMKA